ncbi:hypothetical protein WN48_09533 [Eufriesea mexicana]|nr:hypothetical protein WN48_09533 [Eufriesea mexicana]
MRHKPGAFPTQTSHNDTIHGRGPMRQCALVCLHNEQTAIRWPHSCTYSVMENTVLGICILGYTILGHRVLECTALEDSVMKYTILGNSVLEYNVLGHYELG